MLNFVEKSKTRGDIYFSGKDYIRVVSCRFQNLTVLTYLKKRERKGIISLREQAHAN